MCPVRGVICSQDKMENVSFRAIWYQQQQQPAAAASQQQQQPPAAAAQHQYLLFGLFFETLVFDEHRRNKELKNIFYVSGPGRYLQPRQNGKC